MEREVDDRPTSFTLRPIRDSKQVRLDDAMRAFLEGDADVAREILTPLVIDDPNRRRETKALQHYMFASALSARLGDERARDVNLYLRSFELPQIQLFNLLATKLPIVSLARQVANALLERHLAGQDEVTLLDVGIGTAPQETALLRTMAAHGTLPKRLRVIGVEPAAESLAAAKEALESVGRETGCDVVVEPVLAVAEELTPAHWEFIGSFAAPLVMHGAFALHHMRDTTDGGDTRLEFLRQLRRLDPAAVILCEPSSGHHRTQFTERYANCWHHFNLVFRLIDLQDVTKEEMKGMKTFFGREIQDIVGGDEYERCERHEPVDAWLARLRSSGFSPMPVAAMPIGIAHADVRVVGYDGYTGMDFEGETLVAVLYATSNPS